MREDETPCVSLPSKSIYFPLLCLVKRNIHRQRFKSHKTPTTKITTTLFFCIYYIYSDQSRPSNLYELWFIYGHTVLNYGGWN